MPGIFMEEPPTNDPALMAEWLSRMMTQINAVFQQSWDLEETGIVPVKVQNGMLRYFATGADILGAPGLFVYSQGAWRKMI